MNFLSLVPHFLLMLCVLYNNTIETVSFEPLSAAQQKKKDMPKATWNIRNLALHNFGTIAEQRNFKINVELNTKKLYAFYPTTSTASTRNKQIKILVVYACLESSFVQANPSTKKNFLLIKKNYPQASTALTLYCQLPAQRDWTQIGQSIGEQQESTLSSYSSSITIEPNGNLTLNSIPNDTITPITVILSDYLDKQAE